MSTLTPGNTCRQACHWCGLPAVIPPRFREEQLVHCARCGLAHELHTDQRGETYMLPVYGRNGSRTEAGKRSA